ncbi:hypothetical protein N7G274_006024 [Stereocaulon virgatum]|uniref:Uncharacterized protein n=1 Tax=Stereocaulon virgatum TaxID=373712 RepID=A0ABR4A6I6_9LECA
MTLSEVPYTAALRLNLHKEGHLYTLILFVSPISISLLALKCLDIAAIGLPVMRINHPPDMEGLPPPPYTSHNPSIGNGEVPVLSQSAASPPYQPTLRGGYTRPSLPSESHISSAATYFEDRHVHDAGIHLHLIEHNITITSETTREDLIFPLPIETYIARGVTSLDWSTFVNYLFPLPTQPASEKPRREKDHKPHSFAEEDTPQRRSHIEAVVADWNESFFGPRLIHVNIEFARRSSSSSRSTARPTSTLGITPSETSLNRDFSQPETRYTLPPKNDFSTQPLHRSHSYSSTCSSSSSSSSSSASSIDSIKSKDFEGADINTVRSALLAFRLDTANKHHLRGAIHNLRNEFISFRDRSDLRNKSKEQRKEVKKEVKAVIKEVKAARKADRKLRKAERKSRRDGKRAEHRSRHHHEKSLRKQDRAKEKAMRAQERSARTTASLWAAHATAAEVRARSWESETAAREHAREVTERAQATAAAAAAAAAQNHAGGNWGDAAAGREKARLAESRAQETARNYASRNWGGDATARARQTAHNASSQDWGSYGRERAREAQANARSISGQNWGWYGRERGREAARGPSGGSGRQEQERQEVDGEQETGVLG